MPVHPRFEPPPTTTDRGKDWPPADPVLLAKAHALYLRCQLAGVPDLRKNFDEFHRLLNQLDYPAPGGGKAKIVAKARRDRAVPTVVAWAALTVAILAFILSCVAIGFAVVVGAG